MIIDFRNIERKEVDGFKGGNGPFLTKLADDGKVKIMHNILPAGSSIGLHTHTSNCEVMYILKGTITFTFDGKTETASAGDVHYCPSGHTHCAENKTSEDAEFFAIVPETGTI